MRLFVPLLASFVLTACAPGLIAGTEIEDTPDNREIVALVDSYRKAVEERDESTLLRLVSRRYAENASTTDTSDDDYGYGTLTEQVLPQLHDNVKEVQYRVQLRRVGHDADHAYAEFEFMARFLFTEGGRERWQALNDFNRLDFVREDGAWKIESGL
jgi:hypothetical protein